MEVLVSDNGISLFRKTETIRAYYNVAFNAGDKHDRIVKRETYFVRQPNQLEVSKNKKQNLSYFSQNQAAVQDFVKKYNIDFNRAPDLVRLVSYYNSLAK